MELHLRLTTRVLPKSLKDRVPRNTCWLFQVWGFQLFNPTDIAQVRDWIWTQAIWRPFPYSTIPVSTGFPIHLQVVQLTFKSIKQQIYLAKIPKTHGMLRTCHFLFLWEIVCFHLQIPRENHEYSPKEWHLGSATTTEIQKSITTAFHGSKSPAKDLCFGRFFQSHGSVYSFTGWSFTCLISPWALNTSFPFLR